MRVQNQVDAALAQLLSALCAHRDVEHELPADRDKPFNDVIGAIARRTLLNAVVADAETAREFRVFSLARYWDSCFRDCEFEHEHVIPVDAWKRPLFHACETQDWNVDRRSLGELRTLCARLYLTAYVPKVLHAKLPRGHGEWEVGGDVSDWFRYSHPRVTKFLNDRIAAYPLSGDFTGFDGLQFPGKPGTRMDFVPWQKSLQRKRSKEARQVPSAVNVPRFRTAKPGQ